MKIGEKVLYTAAIGVTMYGVYNAGNTLGEEMGVNDALDTSIEQQAQVVEDYRQEHPEATQMPVDIQDGPAEYAALLLQQSNELRADKIVDLGIGLGGVAVLTGGLILSYRRERRAVMDKAVTMDKDYAIRMAYANERIEAAKAAVAETEAYRQRLVAVQDALAARALSMTGALQQSIEDYASEAGVPKERILETAEELYAALVTFRDKGAAPEAEQQDTRPAQSEQPEPAAPEESDTPTATPERPQEPSKPEPASSAQETQPPRLSPAAMRRRRAAER